LASLRQQNSAGCPRSLKARTDDAKPFTGSTQVLS
jgi:hypothetical protein